MGNFVIMAGHLHMTDSGVHYLAFVLVIAIEVVAVHLHSLEAFAFVGAECWVTMAWSVWTA